MSKGRRDMKRVLLVSAIICTLCVACGKSPTAQVDAPLKPDVALDLSTPDKALKSYWAVRDNIESNQRELSKRSVEQYRAIEQQLPRVISDDMTKDHQPKMGVIESFARD